jgi:hypothetical protein
MAFPNINKRLGQPKFAIAVAERFLEQYGQGWAGFTPADIPPYPRSDASDVPSRGYDILRIVLPQSGRYATAAEATRAAWLQFAAEELSTWSGTQITGTIITPLESYGADLEPGISWVHIDCDPFLKGSVVDAIRKLTRYEGPTRELIGVESIMLLAYRPDIYLKDPNVHLPLYTYRTGAEYSHIAELAVEGRDKVPTDGGYVLASRLVIRPGASVKARGLSQTILTVQTL